MVAVLVFAAVTGWQQRAGPHRDLTLDDVRAAHLAVLPPRSAQTPRPYRPFDSEGIALSPARCAPLVDPPFGSHTEAAGEGLASGEIGNDHVPGELITLRFRSPAAARQAYEAIAEAISACRELPLMLDREDALRVLRAESAGDGLRYRLGDDVTVADIGVLAYANTVTWQVLISDSSAEEGPSPTVLARLRDQLVAASRS